MELEDWYSYGGRLFQVAQRKTSRIGNDSGSEAEDFENRESKVETTW